MRKRYLALLLGCGLTVAALGAAINAPAEVLENLEFFSDLELLSNLEILEDGSSEVVVSASTVPAASVSASTAPAVSTAAFSPAAIAKSTFTRRPYEDR